jgi:TonB family protein
MINKPKPEELTAKQNPQETPQVAKQEPDRDPGRNEKAPDQPGPLSMRKPGAVNPNETPQEAHERGSQNGSNGTPSPDGYVQKRGTGNVDQEKRDPGETTTGEGGAGGGAPRVPNLTDQKEILERVAGGGSVDHLDDVEESDETSLNATKWVHASFFNRLKRSVAQHWDPGGVWRRIDPDGTHYGIKTRITQVRVSLDKKGALKKIAIISPSDVSALDDEGVRAFQAAAPFPNPPEQLADKNGLITFEFGFYFEIGNSRTTWRVNRQ